ncbi:unnamed protein product [Hermetia illucens]|uniref:Uncharacterized protein n=1 Tax=Hermetia illucens TaxID=343691 RepID=A0A7R8YSD0_HERIL|nr:pupal cuticle protein Edg-78E-like [Hermetia illucens]CAD7082440.1 unnamed protein product [Hermetia illucens]
MFKFIVAFALVGLVAADHINKDAQTKSLINDVAPDGSFKYAFDTTNGIAVQEQGNALSAAGSAQWVSPEGAPVSFSYTADENGYQAAGDYVPKTPDYIIRAIEWIRAHPSKEQYVEQVAPPRRF